MLILYFSEEKMVRYALIFLVYICKCTLEDAAFRYVTPNHEMGSYKIKACVLLPLLILACFKLAKMVQYVELVYWKL